MTSIILISLAVVIIIALAAYATSLLLQMRQQTQARQQANEQQRQKHISRDLKVVESIILISKAVSEKQCEISEGCWRLSVLMDSLEQYAVRLNAEFPAIFKLYNKISHMPILEARKALTKKAKLALDLERMGIEEKMQPAVLLDVNKLIQVATSIKSELNKQQQ